MIHFTLRHNCIDSHQISFCYWQFDNCPPNNCSGFIIFFRLSCHPWCSIHTAHFDDVTYGVVWCDLLSLPSAKVICISQSCLIWTRYGSLRTRALAFTFRFATYAVGLRDILLFSLRALATDWVLTALGEFGKYKLIVFEAVRWNGLFWFLPVQGWDAKPSWVFLKWTINHWAICA